MSSPGVRSSFAESFTGTAGATVTGTTHTTVGGARSAFVLIMADAALAATADNKGNLYTLAGSIQSPSLSQTHRCYFCRNPVGGAGHTWSLVIGSAVSPSSLIVYELREVDTLSFTAFKQQSGSPINDNPSTLDGGQTVVHLVVNEGSGTETVTRTDGLISGPAILTGATNWIAYSASGSPPAGTFTPSYTHTPTTDTASGIMAIAGSAPPPMGQACL